MMSPDVQDEWERISQNPDNVIVSDVLKDALSDYYTENSTKSQRVIVSIHADDQSAIMNLVRFEQSPRGWSLICTCSSQTAHSLIRVQRELWSHVVIKIGNDVIRDFKIDMARFRIDVEVSTMQTVNASDCTVIASCVSEQTSNT